MLIIKNVALFDGTSIIKNKNVLVSNNKILDIKSNLTHLSASSNIQILDGKNNLLIPGFIDIQINGGGGFLFNRNPTVMSLQKIFEAHLNYGTTSFFPTFISDSYHQMQKAVEAVKIQLKNPTSGILGIHFEGPFLNKLKRGIHLDSHIQTSSKDILSLILTAKISKTIVTLAPEIIGKKDVSTLIKKNIYVFAGHTNATGEEMKLYFKDGIAGVTHLFNACSQMTARDIGVVGASLLDSKSLNSLIVDGIHIADDALRIAFKLKKAKNFVLISDSMELIGTKKKSFKLFNNLISLEKKSLRNTLGTLAGAHLTMLWAFQNLMKKKLVTLTEAIGMTSTNQAEYFRLKNKGAILPHYDANMLLIDKNNFKLLKVIFFGKII